MNRTSLFGTSGQATAGAIPGVKVTVASIGASNGSAAEVYLLLFEKTTAPQAGDVPTLPSFPIPPAASGSSGQLYLGRAELGEQGCYFDGGLAWAISTSRTAYAAPADATKFSVSVARG